MQSLPCVTVQDGKVQLRGNDKISVLIDGKQTALTVSNTGKTALNIEKLFEHFAVSSSQNTNSGLGLAIVKEICNRYGWQINYNFEKGFHSFSVKFF